jgi:hypothetical protein
MAGLADAGIRAYLGVKQLFGGLDPIEQGILREQEAEAEADPNGTQRVGGNIVGNVLLSAVPASKAAGVVGKVTTALPRWLAPAVSAATVSGGQGLLLNPGKGETFEAQIEDKVAQAKKDAVLGAVTAGAGQLAVKGATRMFTPKSEAEMLFRQGVNPTLQQGAEGSMGRYIGGLTSGAFETRARQEREIENALMRRITKGQALPNATRKEAVQIADDVMEQGYNAFAQGKRVPISPSLRADVHAAGNVISKTGQFGREQGEVSQVLGNIIPDYPRNINVGYRRLQNDYLYPLSEAAGMQKSERARDGILAARARILAARDARLSPEQLAALKELDIRNYDFNRLKEAAKGAGAEKEGISLYQLEKAYSKAPDMVGNRTREELIGPATRVIGQKPNQEQARTLLINAKRAGIGLVGAGAVMNNPIAVALAPLYALSLAGQTKVGAKALMGQYEWQRAVAAAAKKAAPYLAGVGQYVDREYEPASEEY